MKYSDYPKGTFFCTWRQRAWCYTSSTGKVFRLDRGLTTSLATIDREIPSHIDVVGYVPKEFFQ